AIEPTEDAEATRATLTLEAEGTGIAWQDGAPLRLPPELEARLALGSSQIAGRALDRGVLALRIDGRSVRVPEAALAGGFGTVRLAGGEVTLADDTLPPRPVAASGRADVQAFDLGALLGEPRLASRLDGPIELSFAPDAPDRPASGTLGVHAVL